MSSSSSSSLPPLSMGLAHSYNSRGELGAYVNPYACSCTTCVDYVAERSVPFGPQATEPALSSTTLEDMYREMGRIGLSNEAPAPAEPAPSSSVLPQRSMGGGIGLLRGSPGVSVSFLSPSALLASGAYNSSTPALGRTVTGLGSTEYNPLAEAEEEFCNSLRSHRSFLQLQSDDIGRGVEEPTEAQQAEWSAQHDELARKIRAIEDCLLAFGSFFRTR